MIGTIIRLFYTSFFSAYFSTFNSAVIIGFNLLVTHLDFGHTEHLRYYEQIHGKIYTPRNAA